MFFIELFLRNRLTSTQRDLLGPLSGLGGNLAIASRAAASALSSASASATAAAAAAVSLGSFSCLLDLHLSHKPSFYPFPLIHTFSKLYKQLSPNIQATSGASRQESRSRRRTKVSIQDCQTRNKYIRQIEPLACSSSSCTEFLSNTSTLQRYKRTFPGVGITNLRKKSRNSC